MRWFIGDIQGCAREFEQLLQAIRYDPERDEVWCLGDLVNRGPHSLEALRLWADCGAKAILGNHDIYALRAHSGAIERKPDSLQPLFEAPDGAELLARLRACPILVNLPAAGHGPELCLVHAGLHPQWTDLRQVAAQINEVEHTDAWLESADVNFATRVRCCTDAGKICRHSGVPADCPEGSKPWDAFYRGEPLVVHGHWARRGYYRTQRTLGLDSGCVYGGPLTAWCQEDDHIVQVWGSAA